MITTAKGNMEAALGRATYVLNRSQHPIIQRCRSAPAIPARPVGTQVELEGPPPTSHGAFTMLDGLNRVNANQWLVPHHTGTLQRSFCVTRFDFKLVDTCVSEAVAYCIRL